MMSLKLNSSWNMFKNRDGNCAWVENSFLMHVLTDLDRTQHYLLFAYPICQRSKKSLYCFAR